MPLERLDSAKIPRDPAEVRLFTAVRNEAARLPYFFHYYFSRGVDRIFVVDNDSGDATRDICLASSNVHLFQTDDSYAASNYGVDWMRALLDEYGVGYWCVVVDVDEILVYPGWEKLTIPDVCICLEKERVSALRCLLLDMYSEGPLAAATCAPGEDPLDVCPHFETESIVCISSPPRAAAGDWRHHGGMRQRLFGAACLLDKVSVLKYHPAMTLRAGMHSLLNARLSSARGALLHFKYINDFKDRAATEAQRGEHWDDASEYRKYADAMTASPNLTAFSTDSHSLSSSSDLLYCGVMKSSVIFEQAIRDQGR